MNEVLQKIIAVRNGLSRRQAEGLIRSGSVMLDGKIAKLGDRGNETSKILVNGRELRIAPDKIYIMLNKPKGYTCTNRYFAGEHNIFELVPINEKLFAVGRLDKDSRGLILLTNDGALAEKLSHPRYGCEKEYEVLIDQDIDVSKKLTAGIDIKEEDGVVWAKKAKYLKDNKYSVILSQGKKRQIRRMFQVLDIKVLDLRRIKLANLELKDLREGKSRQLTSVEIQKLKKF